MQGEPCSSLNSPNPLPLTVRKGFDLNPKPLCPLQGRGLTAQVGRPTFTEYIKVKMTIKVIFYKKQGSPGLPKRRKIRVFRDFCLGLANDWREVWNGSRALLG